MKRRQFIKKTALTSAAAIGVPYILPTGRLFATTNPPLANHVVFVLFAGGVRHQESIQQKYLAESQGVNSEGNIMYNMLDGAPPELKIVYGQDVPNGLEGAQPISPILQTSLESQGTLFPEVRFGGSTGHFGGLSSGVSGHYAFTQGLKNRPVHPTIFEYLRRFGGYKATDTWFIGNGIGNSTPLLNYSAHPDYGGKYGANFFAPNVTFGQQGHDFIEGFKTYHPEEELDPILEMRAFLNHNFMQTGGEIPNLNNTEEEKENIKAFIKETFAQKAAGQIAFPTVNDNGDLQTIGYATEVLKWFKPKVTVINMSAVDSCHENYTSYLRNLHRGDHGVGFLWNYIQNKIPEMAGNTALVVMPEHGRNLNSNGILDENDWFAYDHDSDPNSRRIFTLMAGPGIEAGLRVGTENNPIGDATDVTLTIAEILGIKDDVANAGLVNGGSMSLFDRI
ncbi:MAG: hypothetical protein ACI9XO_000164 [Paraglaciecola sp.]|jgi:hypothetical protein